MEGVMENRDIVKKKELKKFRKKKKVKFDPKKLADIIGNIVRDKNENECVYVNVMYCRMDFGEELKYDPSGENDRTYGKPCLLHGDISFNKNGMPRYHAKRNHPRRVTERGQSYEEYIRKFIVAGRLGLESYTAIETIEEYLVGYFCKGTMSSMESDTML
eukprot:4645279-Ditylum_brightwellii.AAC.1